MGPSGMGKTTLLRYLSGLLHANKKDEGSNCLKHSLFAPLKNKIAFLGADDRLLPWLSVEKNIGLADLLKYNPLDTKRIQGLLEVVQLTHTKNLYPHELSKGMTKRILLARALYQNRSLLFLDEPFTNMDEALKKGMFSHIKKILKGQTVLFVTHQEDEVHALADACYTLKNKPLMLAPLAIKEPYYAA